MNHVARLTHLQPGQPFVGGADKVIELNITKPSPPGDFEINGHPFIPPNVPVLLQILSGTTNANQLLPNGSVYNLPANKVIEVNIPGGGNVRPSPILRLLTRLTTQLASIPSSWGTHVPNSI